MHHPRLLLSGDYVYLLLGAVGVWVARCGGRPLLSWLFQPEYAIHRDVFETAMLLAVMAYLAGAISSALVASRIIAVQMPLQSLSLLTTCVTSFWLVPEFGLWGASMSLALSKLPFITIGMSLLIRATRVVRPPVIQPSFVSFGKSRFLQTGPAARTNSSTP